MKPFPKLLLCMAVSLCFSFSAHAQILKDISNRLKQKSEQRANQKIDQGIDKGLDKVDNAAKDATKKKDTTASSSSSTGSDKQRSETNNTTTASTNSSDTNGQLTKGTDEGGFKTYSKFDFIPGDKVIAYDDFSQDAIGDFPVNWNTNSSGEVVSSSIQAGHWLMIKKQGRFIPEYLKSLPDNFTFEYDVICNGERLASCPHIWRYGNIICPPLQRYYSKRYFEAVFPGPRINRFKHARFCKKISIVIPD